jgi:exonuclease VII small subunit
MGVLPPVFVELKANINEFSAKMGEANAEMQTLQKKGEVSFSKLGAVAKTALLGVAGLAAGVAVAGVHMADEFEKSHVKLETALKNVGTSYEKFATQIKTATDSQAKLGYNSAETESALATLTTSLKDPKLALKDLALATDLARYKNIDLTTASIAVAKAQEGNLRPLKQLGIDLPVAAGGALKLEKATTNLQDAQDKLQEVMSDPKHTVKQLSDAQDKLAAAQKKVNDVSGSGTEIMAGLTKAIGGQANAAAETFGGKMDALKTSVENSLTTIGMALMPTLMDLADYLEKNVVPMIKDFTDGLSGITGSSDGATTSAKNFGNEIRNIVKFITDNKKVFEVFGESIAAAFLVGKASTAASALVGALGLIRTAFATTTATAAVTAEAEAAATGGASLLAATPAMLALAAFFGTAMFTMLPHGGLSQAAVESNNARGGFRGGGSGAGNIVPSTVPMIAPDHIPMLASGGIVSKSTLAMIGEAGPEAVVPLSKMGSMGSGLVVNITVQGSVVQERDLAITVRDNIAQLMRRRGLNPNILGV